MFLQLHYPPASRVDLVVQSQYICGAAVLLFLNLGSRMIVGRRDAVLWEAGANPALPRNCKRGQRDRSLGMSEKTTWEGRLQQPDAGRKLRS